MIWFQAVFALTIKEFLALLRDKRSRLVLIAPPILQVLVFGYAATFDVNHIPIAIYNEDKGADSRAFISRFSGAQHFEIVQTIHHNEQIAPLINQKKVLMVLHLEAQFSEHLRQNVPAKVQIILDGRNSNTAQIALNYTQQVVLAFNQSWAETHGTRHQPAIIEARSWYNENLQSRWFIVPGIIGLITLIVTLIVTALSVAREREAGTFDQLLVTPLTPLQILIGKALPGMVIGIAEATLIILFALYWFDIPMRGSLGALYLGLGLFLMSAVGVGLMISTLSTTQQQAILGAFVFLVPAVILSGFATPIENMPEAVQLLTYIDPLRYLMVITRGVLLEGYGYEQLLNQYWPMTLIGLASLSVTAWLFKKRTT